MKNYIEIPVGKNARFGYAKVSKDYAWLTNHHWTFDGKYPKTKIGDKKYRMHQLVITSVPKGLVTDHINGDRFDNRTENLRICTYRENIINAARRSDNKTGYKGVIKPKRSNKYYAHIGFMGKQIHLGSYDTAEEAHEVYTKAAKVYFGEFARTQ